ncbi:MAG: hypothetical protein AAF224_01340 [Pseudomonadota bacterium]
MRAVTVLFATVAMIGMIIALSLIGGFDTFHELANGNQIDSERKEGLSDGFFTELFGWLLTILIGFVFVQLASIFTTQNIYKESNRQLSSGLVRQHTTFLRNLLAQIRDTSNNVRWNSDGDESFKGHASVHDIDDTVRSSGTPRSHYTSDEIADYHEKYQEDDKRYPEYYLIVSSIEQYNQLVRANKVLRERGESYELNVRNLKPYWAFLATATATGSGRNTLYALKNEHRDFRSRFGEIIRALDLSVSEIAKKTRLKVADENNDLNWKIIRE